MAARRVVAPEGVARIGCSGYEYDDWVGGFYSRGLDRRDRLSFYAAAFDAVELNSTFYRLPSESTVERWRSVVPAGFVFAVKCSAFGTHRKHLRDPDTWFPRFADRIRLLGPHRGPVLAQLPPRWRADPARLAAFLAVVPSGWRVAVEVRDPTWLVEPVYAVLADHGAALVHHDLVGHHPRVTTADWAYLRFHGPDPARPYAGGYSGQALAGAARRVDRLLAEGRDVYAFFNNDVGGAAPADARRLARFVAGRRSLRSERPHDGRGA